LEVERNNDDGAHCLLVVQSVPIQIILHVVNIGRKSIT